MERFVRAGICLQAREVVKLAKKHMALSNLDQGGVAIPTGQLLIEPRHLRSDDSSPGDLYVTDGGHSAKNAATYVMISTSLSTSNLFYVSSSSDYALRQA